MDVEWSLSGPLVPRGSQIVMNEMQKWNHARSAYAQQGADGAKLGFNQCTIPIGCCLVFVQLSTSGSAGDLLLSLLCPSWVNAIHCEWAISGYEDPRCLNTKWHCFSTEAIAGETS